ncbi:MAG: amino acid adenylation domain-containing protein [Candidatus Aminicenantes bacterium]|jgi:amino acid adenylation domain-containing protein
MSIFGEENMLKGNDLEMLLLRSRYVKQKNYWIKEFSREFDTTDILKHQETYRRGTADTIEDIDNGDRARVEIPLYDELSRQIIKISKNSDLSIYILLLSALKSLIHRYTVNKNIIILSPVHKLKTSEKTLNSLLFIRDQVDGALSFKELVINVRNSVLEAYENQDYPYDKLVESLFAPSSPGEKNQENPPVISHILCWLGNIHREWDIEKIKARLSFGFLREKEQVRGYVLYDTGTYQESEITSTANHFVLLLARGIENINVRISGIDFLTAQEKKQLLEDFNNNRADFSRNKTITQWIEGQVEKSPAAVAITFKENKITYREFNHRANRLAWFLGEKGIANNVLVGVLCERSNEMMMAILAVWKAGGAYIPIDINTPWNRINRILADSAAEVLLSKSSDIPDVNEFYKEITANTRVRHIIYLDKVMDIRHRQALFKTFRWSWLLSQGIGVTPGNDIPLMLSSPHQNLPYQEADNKIKQLCQYISHREVPIGSPAAVMSDNPIYQIIAITYLNLQGIPFIVLQPGSPREQKRQIIHENRINTVFSEGRFLDELDQLLWESSCFKNYILLDHYDGDTSAKEFYFKELWNFMAEGNTEAVNDYGWVNSYNNETFTVEEMNEYISNFKEKLEPFLTPQSRVLEIGCGHGLVLFELAAHVGYYLATDLSPMIIEKNKRRVQQEGLQQVELKPAAASEIRQLGEKNFDLVICSSVIHYFPNSLYLEALIKDAIAVLKDQGIIYLDDLLDLRKKQQLIRSVLEYKEQNPEAQVKKQWDDDLFVDVDFFHDLEQKYPQIVQWEVSGKLGRIENELTRFRYDVLLKIDKRVKNNSSWRLKKNRITIRDIETLCSGSDCVSIEGKEKVTQPQSGSLPWHQEYPAAPLIGDVSDTAALETYSQKNLDFINHPSDLAYVIYTSGSTGKPKGAMVEHIGMMNHIHAKISELQLEEKSIVAQNAPHTFDISVWQFFTALTRGGRTVVYPQEVILEPDRFISRLIEDGVTVLEVVPSYLSVLLEFLDTNFRNFDSLKYLLVTGETINPALVSQWFDKYPAIKMVNAYGPTEASDDITHLVMDKAANLERVPIGKPLQNFNIYIVDDYLNLCPPGIVGEIGVSGIGVGRGYLNNPQLTFQRFLFGSSKSNKSYMSPGSKRIYLTGDLGRWLPEGVIEFFGRKDYQVKIRGFRIELGEIEKQLSTYPGIKEAAVIVKTVDRGRGEGSQQPTSDYLCACYLPAGGEKPDILAIKDHLAQQLPAHMIPDNFIELAHMPLTANGKIDRKVLSRLDERLTMKKDHVVPRNKVEHQLVQLWADVLAMDSSLIGIDTSFFELGGNSLRATVLISKLNKEFNVMIPLAELFQTPFIRHLAQYIEGLKENRFTSIEVIEEKEYFRLSSTQKRLYVLQQMDLEGIGYNVVHAYLLEGELDKKRLAKTFQGLIRRHESLRTSFGIVNGEPVQKIHQQVEFEIEYCDIKEVEVKVEEERSSLSEGTRGLAPLFIKEFIRPFDLSHSPLVRVGLIRLHTPPFGHPSQEGNVEDKHILIVDMHHIITDGISIGLFIRESLALYAGEQLSPLKLQYKDYAQWQTSEPQQKAIKQQEEYWLKQFAGEVPVLNLPLDYPRPAVQSFEGAALPFELPVETTRALNRLALDTGATLYMVLLALYNVLLSKISGQEDILVGTPIAARRHVDLERIIGMFVNTLAMRNWPWGDKKFIDFLLELQQRTVAAFENQEYQFEDLVGKVFVNRDTSRNPLFDTMFVLQNMEAQANDIPGADIFQLTIRPYEIETRVSICDLLLSCFETDGKLHCAFVYCTKLFKKETIERFIVYFQQVLSAVFENRHQKISQIQIITQEEKQQILDGFNDTISPSFKDKSLHKLFEEQVERTADNVAVVGPMGMEYRTYMTYISYKELNEKANQLAWLLIVKGVKPDTVVGIMVERCVDMIIGILGILKAGGAYLPIDPDSPQGRIDYMLKDSGTEILLKENDFRPAAFNNRPPGTPTQLHLTPAPVTCAAYIIYTSGTTGSPKGVMIDHGSVFNSIYWRRQEYKMKPGDRALQLFSFAFDGFITSFFTPAVSGVMGVLLRSEEVKDITRIKETIVTKSITHFICVPSLYQSLMEISTSKELSGLKLVTLAGEQVHPGIVEKSKRIHPMLEICNEYGPTEGSIVVSYYRDVQPGGFISIGKPINNAVIYIIDKNRNLVPIGISGELAISGKGLARGYLNQPELTDKKFLHGFAEKTKFHKALVKSAPPDCRRQKIYKTGDLARWHLDGNIEFLGRIDHQMKIRGYRIETAEIEQHLLKIKGIKKAVVIGKQDKDKIRGKYLCAYIVIDASVEERELTVSGIKEHLSGWLPDYMIPQQLETLEEIPLTAGGKIDRKKLLEMDISFEPKDRNNYTAPRDENEKILAEIWSHVLNIEKVGIYDNFFSIGGDSISSIIVISQAREKGLHISNHQFFQHPTIDGVIRNMDRKEPAEQQENMSAVDYLQPFALVSRSDQENLPPGIEDAYPLRMRQVDFLIQHDSFYGNSFLNFIVCYKLKERFHREKFERAVQLLVERHPIFRTTYDLINYSQYLQLVHKEIPLPLVIEDLSGVSPQGQEGILKAAKENKKQQPIDWEKPGLIDFMIHILDDETFHFTCRFHTSVVDGWSQMLIITRLFTTYRLLLGGTEFSPGVKLEASFKDAVARELESLTSDKVRKYWRDRLAGSGFKRILRQSGAPSSGKSNPTGYHPVTFPPGLSRQLKKSAESLQVPIKIVMLTAHCVVIGILMGSRDIVTGYEVNVRPEKKDGDKIVGIFTNIIPFRLIISKEKHTWSDLTQKVYQAETDLIPFKHYPLAQIKEDLRKPELFESVFNFTHFRGYKMIDDSTNIESTLSDLIPVSDYTLRAEFGLNTLTDDAELTIFYHTDVLSKDDIKFTADCYLEVLQQMGENPSGSCELQQMTLEKNKK